MQFGFKKGHSTSMCKSLVKETGSYFTNNNSSKYCVFIYATKPFDRVSYAKLFIILLNRHIPSVIVRCLLNSYSVQSMRVTWNNNFSNEFRVSDDVKQGAILSPILFCLYIDGLLFQLKQTNVGCFVGRTFYGVVACAVDATLLVPTPQNYDNNENYASYV
jgi:Reverse transcriptase (RNA-dependent DNA polymerase)